MKLHLRWFLFLALLAMLATVGSGCKSTEPDNISSRPWNSPRGYDSGVPGMFQPPR